MFYPLGKNSEKPYGGGIHPRLYVRGLSYTQHIFFVES